MSLRATIVASITYVLVLVIVVLEVPLVINLTRRVDAEIKAEASGQAQIVATSAGDRLDEDVSILQPLVEEAARALGGRVIIVDQSGRLLVDSVGPELRGEDYSDRPEIAAALSGELSQGERRSESLNEDLLYTAVPIVQSDQTVGAVRVTQSVSAVGEEVRNDAIGLVGVGVAALLLGIAVAWVLAGFLSRPPRLLADAARRVAGGELDARAPEVGPTEQREVAQAFNEMTERLSAVLASQRDFVANASHQLRTPLTGLRLRLEAAANGANEPSLRRDLRAAESEVERMARLIDNLLTLAREGQRPPSPQVVDLQATRDEAIERWKSEATEAGARLEVSATPDSSVLASAWADEVGIILDNLIDNAIRYSGTGGRVTVECGRQGDAEVYVAVDDNGPGLAAGEERRAIERFTRGKAAAGTSGTGLGLAIVDTLARRWGGRVELGRSDAGGLRALVVLPSANTPNETLAAG